MILLYRLHQRWLRLLHQKQSVFRARNLTWKVDASSVGTLNIYIYIVREIQRQIITCLDTPSLLCSIGANTFLAYLLSPYTHIYVYKRTIPFTLLLLLLGAKHPSGKHSYASMYLLAFPWKLFSFVPSFFSPSSTIFLSAGPIHRCYESRNTCSICSSRGKHRV